MYLINREGKPKECSETEDGYVDSDGVKYPQSWSVDESDIVHKYFQLIHGLVTDVSARYEGLLAAVVDGLMFLREGETYLSVDFVGDFKLEGEYREWVDYIKTKSGLVWVLAPDNVYLMPPSREYQCFNTYEDLLRYRKLIKSVVSKSAYKFTYHMGFLVLDPNQSNVPSLN